MTELIDSCVIQFDDAAKVRVTPDGYLVASPRVARTGIQLYRGSEVGVSDKAVVKIYRPDDQVFDEKSMSTFAHKPVTNDHPPEAVTSKNWSKYAKGQIGDEIARDGDFIRVPMVLMDQATIDDVRDGKVELSVGYTCDLDMTPGTTPSGEAYDGVQKNIRVNHTAFVDAARAGPMARFGDSSSKGKIPHIKEKNMTKHVVDGITVEMDDTAIQVVDKTIKGLNDTIATLRATSASVTTDHTKVVADMTGQITKLTADLTASTTKAATLESQLKDSAMTPEKLEGLVRDRSVMIQKAKALHPAVVVDGKTDNDIRKQVVDTKIGDVAKGWPDDQIKISFDTLAAGVNVDTLASAIGVSDLASSFSQPAPQKMDAVYDARNKRLEDAWKGSQQKH